MASAFDFANTILVLATSSPSVAAISEPQEQQQPLTTATASAPAAESETEDEEVKMNCVGGVRGMEESDLNTTDRSCCESEDDDDEEESNNGEDEEGVVSFVTGHLRGALPLVRPKATPPPQRPTLSPHMEGQEEMETSGNSSSDNDEEEDGDVNDDEASTVASDHQPSVGARGVALSLGTPSGISDADASSSENDDDEDSDVEETESGPLANKNSIVDPAALTTGTRLEQDMEDKKQDLGHELLSMNEVLGQSLLAHDMDDSESALDHLLGVVHDRDEFINLPKTKRVLSFNTLAALNAESGRSVDSPKRLKAGNSMLSTSFMPAFCLGAPAVEHEQIKMNFRIEAHRESPIISSSDEEDLDGQLRDELDPHAEDERSIGRDNSPVPLLTPPGSPLTIEIDGGGTTTVCEWPSNLAVDNAMRAAADQEGVPEVSRSMSPDVSVQEEDSDYTLSGSGSSSSQAVFDPSSLTPLLQGISVGNHR